MDTEELIILLIQQDMKHQQLVEYICRAGFETYMHGLDIPHIVAELMGLNNIPDAWMEIYMKFLGTTVYCPISGKSEIFRELAKECYVLLKNHMS